MRGPHGLSNHRQSARLRSPPTAANSGLLQRHVCCLPVGRVVYLSNGPSFSHLALVHCCTAAVLHDDDLSQFEVCKRCASPTTSDRAAGSNFVVVNALSPQAATTRFGHADSNPPRTGWPVPGLRPSCCQHAGKLPGEKTNIKGEPYTSRHNRQT
jgi:hypothetical protein